MKKNSFEEVNRARCFNHMLQLSAKTLLKLFNAGMSTTKPAFEEEEPDNEMPLDNDGEGDDKGNGGDDGDKDGDDDGEAYLDSEGEPEDANSDGIDELNQLDEQEHQKVLMDTAVVRQTVTKVCSDPS
jgi:hypothetical protein